MDFRLATSSMTMERFYKIDTSMYVWWLSSVSASPEPEVSPQTVGLGDI